MDIFNIVRAAESSVVSCTGGDCGVCSALETASNIYNFILGLAFAAAFLVLVAAGLVYIFTTGRQRYLAKAKIFARNGILGFILLLASWLAIQTLFLASGYKNAGSWWQFRCESGSATAESPWENYPVGSLSSLKTYPSLAGFIVSGDEKGIINQSVAPGSMASQLENLKEGEELTFYLPARKNYGDHAEIKIPFLAGYKSDGQFQIDSQRTIDLLQYLLQSFESDNNSGTGSDVSLLNSSGSTLSEEEMDRLINQLAIEVLSSVGELNLNGNFNVDQEIELATKRLNELMREIENNNIDISDITKSPSEEVMENLVNDLTENAGGVVVQKGETDADNYNSNRSNPLSSGNGDRSLVDSNGDRAGTSSNGDRSANDNLWKNTQNQNRNQNQNSAYRNLPSSQGENPVGPTDNLDKIRDKDKDDSKSCDYSQATNPVEEALIRIECKDQLRYNMIHRFVKVIQNTSFQGGFTESCGKIAVNFSFPRQLLDQLIMHEATHAGQFCLGLIDMSQPSKVEREACANQMGSLCHEKHDENGGKGTEDYLMQEITCAGEKGKDGKGIACRQKPHIEYRTSSAGSGDEEVRGYFSRWEELANPSGDLKCEAYDWPVKYALSYGDTTMGPYHYGAHACGEQRVLGLKEEENNDVKEIVKSQKECQSKARPNLPKAKECENSGASPIEIDSTPVSPPGM